MMSGKYSKKPGKPHHIKKHAKKTRSVSFVPGKCARTASDDSNTSVLSSPKKRVTMADIARCAGVSQTSVSITLADRRDIVIPESTRDHIKNCAYDLGYFPSRLGDGFFHGRSKIIGILAVADSYFPFLDCMGGLQEELATADYVSMIISLDWLRGYAKADFTRGWQCAEKLPGLSRLLEYQVEGIICFSGEQSHTEACIDELTSRNIPMVILGGAVHPSGGVDTIGGDNEAIGQPIVEPLLPAGYTSAAAGKAAARLLIQCIEGRDNGQAQHIFFDSDAA